MMLHKNISQHILQQINKAALATRGLYAYVYRRYRDYVKRIAQCPVKR